jgi:arylsulfatase A-like enzyme
LTNKKKPFFIGMAPIGPHSWFDGTVKWDATKLKSNIPASAPRHQTLFPVETLPRPESFNPDEVSGVSWVRTLPKLNDTELMYMDDYYRGRLRSLQPIDELVEQVVKRLTDAGQLDNTYIIFTSDNGFAMGTHRRQPGKTLGFEEDINVPLIIRGPGIPKGVKDELSTYNMVDLSRTIMELGRAKTDYENDGVMINLHQGEKTKRSSDGSKITYDYARHSISEYWIMTVEEGVFAGPNRQNNSE